MIFLLLACTDPVKDTAHENLPAESSIEPEKWGCTGSKLTSVDVGWGLVCGIDETGCLGCLSIPAFLETSNTPPTGIFKQVSLVHSADDLSYSYFPGYGCALDVDGYVHCWGESLFGQTEPPPDKFASISVGREFACGILETGLLKCWGRYEIVDSEQHYVSVDTGLYGACARTIDGSLNCWNVLESESTVAQVESDALIFDVEFGICLLNDSQTVECRSEASNADPGVSYSNVTGSAICTMGLGYCVLDSQKQVTCSHPNDIMMDVPLLSISCVGTTAICGLTEDETGRCWSQETGVFSLPL